MSEQKNYDYSKIIPSKEIVDLTKLGEPLSTKNGFSNAVMNLGCTRKLPAVFPAIPNISSTKVEGVTMNNEAKESLLTLPLELYDSETYDLNPLLRGPLEEILIANERERVKCGFTPNRLMGNGWSEHFRKRFEKFKPIIGPIESDILLDEVKEDKIPKDLGGSKIA